jgi:tryptophan-rich sensory protein
LSIWSAVSSPYGVAGGIGAIILGVGGLLTEIGPWYRGLNKPSWQPPDFLFAPAWTLIFAFAAWSAGLAWKVAPGEGWRTTMVLLFLLNGCLNIAWSLLFFKWRRPDWALVEVAVLWLSIVVLMLWVGHVSGQAALLLVPYLLWVSFAAFLNRTIVKLNGSFA